MKARSIVKITNPAKGRASPVAILSRMVEVAVIYSFNLRSPIKSANFEKFSDVNELCVPIAYNISSNSFFNVSKDCLSILFN